MSLVVLNHRIRESIPNNGISPLGFGVTQILFKYYPFTEIPSPQYPIATTHASALQNGLPRQFPVRNARHTDDDVGRIAFPIDMGVIHPLPIVISSESSLQLAIGV